jgi:guanylate kinase
MSNKHTIFAFVGASGSGKTTLMTELLNFFPHIQIIKSTSTRPRRDEIDDLFYKFVDKEYIESNKESFLSHEIYMDNDYIYEKNVLDSVLSSRCGMFAILEHTIPIIQNHGYNLKLIKVIPDRDWQLPRAKLREKADNERGTIDLNFDLVLQNSFGPGGLELSVQQLAGFISQVIATHVAILT